MSFPSLKVFLDTVSIAETSFVDVFVCRDSDSFDIDNATNVGLNALVGLQKPGFTKGALCYL